MRLLSYSGQFKRDVKLAMRCGKDLKKLRHVTSLLLAGNWLAQLFHANLTTIR